MRRSLPGLVVAVLLAALPRAPAAQGAPGAGPPPNVLLIIADDLGTDRVGAYGEHPDPGHTPVIDAIAAHGVLFRNAWSNPTCGPSRATLLTGRYARHTGFGHGSAYATEATELGLDEPMLPKALPAGYRTAAVGKWHLASAHLSGLLHPNLCGFEHFRGSMESPPGLVGDGYWQWERVVDGVAAPCTTYATTRDVDDALELIASFGNAPWFVWLAFHAPHAPYHAPPPALHSFVLPADVAANIPIHYQAMVEAMDTEIGRLLLGIDPAVRARTVVIVLGDNGTPAEATTAPFLPEHAKGTVYEGGVNVPLIVAGPGVVQGAECGALVDTTDLFATIAELTGSTGAPPQDSVSFASCLSHPAMPGPRQTVYAELFMPNGSGPYVNRQRAVRDARFKLIELYTKTTIPVATHLFDLAADPFELHDLLAGPLGSAQQTAFDALSAQLAEVWPPWQEVGTPLPGTVGAPLLSGSGSLSPQSPIALQLEQGRPLAPAVLVVGPANIGDWFKGGLFVPRPDALLPVFVGPAGTLTIPGHWPAQIPSGASLLFQVWIADPAGPMGWAASNGLAANAP